MSNWVNERRINPGDSDGAQTWVAALQRSGIPPRYWDCVPDLVRGDRGWLTQALTNPAESWAGQGWGFYIHGPFDTGKSSVAAILAMDMAKRCHAVEWMSVRDIPGVMFQENDEARQRFRRLKGLDLLVIDDLGSQRFRLKTAAGTAIEDLARIMFDRKRPIIYTSNVPWPSFPATFHEIEAFVSVVQRTTRPVPLLDPWGNRPGMSHGA